MPQNGLKVAPDLTLRQMVAVVQEQNETLREMNVALYSLVTKLCEDRGLLKPPFAIRSAPIVDAPHDRAELPHIDTRPDRPNRKRRPEYAP